MALRLISATGNQRGFTLLEMMLVALIIGLLATAVSLSLPDSGQQRLDRDAKRLYAVLSVTLEEAIYRNRDYGILIASNRYQVLQRQGRQWVPLQSDNRLGGVQLEADTRLNLSVNGMAVELPAEAPQILVASDGQLSPFELTISRDDAPHPYRLSALFGGDLRLQQELQP